MLVLHSGGVERILDEHDKVLLINNYDQETLQGANIPSFLLNIAHTYTHKHKGERVQSSPPCDLSFIFLVKTVKLKAEPDLFLEL